jgi:GAF domain-containing protein
MFETKKPIIIRDTSKYDRWVIIEGEEFLRSYAGSPIIVRDEVIGFLNVDSSTANFFTSMHIETLKTFADYAAIAIDNAEMHQKVRQHADELDEQVNIATRELHKRAAELETLYKIGKDITSTLDLRTMLQVITDASAKIVAADESILVLIEDGKKELASIVGCGISEEELHDSPMKNSCKVSMAGYFGKRNRRYPEYSKR